MDWFIKNLGGHMSTDPTDSHKPIELAQSIYQKVPFFSKQSNRRLVGVLLIFCCLIVVFSGGFLAGMQAVSPNRTPASQPVSQYPAFLVSNPPEAPQAGLPYTASNVFDTFLAKGMKMSDVTYTNGWACCVTYQPEGKMVYWEESYGVVLAIATFATPSEAKTDAHDLLTNSAGYSTYTKNLCLFFYDHSISKAHLTDYMTAMSTVCT
jgi:hypothetical protein